MALAVGALAANPADAAGLGRLTVQSALGQPLRAEVEITSLTRDEASSLTARLAPPEAFRQAGLEYNPALTNLRFSIEQRNNRPVVRIQSAQPINEPFVDLLVELNWASGKFVREYTFLLDPPELKMARGETIEGGASRSDPITPAAAAPAQRAPASPVASPPVAQAPAAPSTPPAAEPARPSAPARAERAAAPPPAPAARGRSDSSGTFEVRRGDTLSGVASAVRPEG
ncbi:MAG TPA: pilus assembly protein FimV, partial [Burkholderiaceae bacterium]|nr:pilus assembly protein FimV [Burkholderiaceae bacterium]